MFESDKKSALDRLKKGLYSRTTPEEDSTRRHVIHDAYKPVASSWDSSNKPPEVKANADDFIKFAQKKPMHHKVLIFSFGFFVLTLLIALYTFFGGSNFVSVNNINIVAEGVVAVAGGDTLELDVSVINDNSTDLQLVDLIADFPDGSKDPENPSKDLTQSRISIGDIPAHSAVHQKVKVILFGEQNEKKLIHFGVEYRTAGSSAIFYKEKTYDIAITSSPVLVTIESIDSVISGQEAEARVTVSSNSLSIVRDLMLVMDYPFGFTFTSSVPKPVTGNNVFLLGDLAPGAKKTFTIRGALQGQDGENRVLKARVGVQSKTDARDVSAVIISDTHRFSIEKPFIGTSLALNGVSDGLVTSAPGELIRGEVTWTNNLSTRVTDVVVEIKLAGNILDKNSVTVEGGSYNSLTNTITWDSRQDSRFKLLAPGESGRASFAFSSQRLAPGSYPVNPEMNVSIGVKGARIDEGNVLEGIPGSSKRVVRLKTQVETLSKTLARSGLISNSGPVPPQAEKTTTYSVVWTINNSSNSISNGIVKAHLPANVSWTGVTKVDGDMSFDPSSGDILWTMGDVPRGAGVTKVAPQATFQVAITPSVTDKGSLITLVDEGVFTGGDDFTGEEITARVRSVNTQVSDMNISNNGIVQ